MDSSYGGERIIDWDDEESEDRYIIIPAIESNEGYRMMEKFALAQPDAPRSELLDVLGGSKPFRRFKDTIFELGLRDAWHAFEQQQAEEEIRDRMETEELDYDALNAKYIASEGQAD